MNNIYKILHDYLKTLGLDENIVDETTQCFRTKHYQKSEYFAFAGQNSDKLGFVVDGLFSMYVEQEGGNVFTKDFLQNKDFLLANFEPEDENQVYLQAIKDSLILEAKHSDIQRLFNRYEDFRVLAERGTQRRYQEICERLELLATMNATERYLTFKSEYGQLEHEIPP